MDVKEINGIRAKFSSELAKLEERKSAMEKKKSELIGKLGIESLEGFDIDAEIDFKDITKKLQNDLKKLAPHGPCNPKPLLCTRNVYDYGGLRRRRVCT